MTIYSVEGLAGLGGGWCSVAGDRFSQARAGLGLMIQAVAAGLCVLVGPAGNLCRRHRVRRGLWRRHAALRRADPRKLSLLRMIGAIMGAATSVSTLGMALGPLVGGYLRPARQLAPGYTSDRSPSVGRGLRRFDGSGPRRGLGTPIA